MDLRTAVKRVNITCVLQAGLEIKIIDNKRFAWRPGLPTQLVKALRRFRRAQGSNLVCYTAVFSVVTQRSSPLS